MRRTVRVRVGGVTMGNRRQSRRAISIKGITYQWVQEHCRAEGRSVSGFIEELVEDKMRSLGIIKPTVLLPRPKKVEKEPEAEPHHPAHFTF